MRRVPLAAWVYLGWLVALVCVALMVLEGAARRPVLPSQRRGCLWLCVVVSGSFACDEHCPEGGAAGVSRPRARDPPPRP